jgi:hypothetical protein
MFAKLLHTGNIAFLLYRVWVSEYMHCPEMLKNGTFVAHFNPKVNFVITSVIFYDDRKEIVWTLYGVS